MRVAVEAGIQQGWEKYIGSQGGFVGMNSFGASAPAETLFEFFGLTPDAVCQSVTRLLAAQR